MQLVQPQLGCAILYAYKIFEMHFTGFAINLSSTKIKWSIFYIMNMRHNL